jgi:hypothetical protein
LDNIFEGCVDIKDTLCAVLKGHPRVAAHERDGFLIFIAIRNFSC